MISSLREINSKWKLREDPKKRRVLSLLINVDDVISLGTGKTVAPNIDADQEEEIDQALNQVPRQVTEESKILIILERREKAEEDLLHLRVSHLARVQALHQRGRNMSTQSR